MPVHDGRGGPAVAGLAPPLGGARLPYQQWVLREVGVQIAGLEQLRGNENENARGR